MTKTRKAQSAVNAPRLTHPFSFEMLVGCGLWVFLCLYILVWNCNRNLDLYLYNDEQGLMAVNFLRWERGRGEKGENPSLDRADMCPPKTTSWGATHQE